MQKVSDGLKFFFTPEFFVFFSMLCLYIYIPGLTLILLILLFYPFVSLSKKGHLAQ